MFDSYRLSPRLPVHLLCCLGSDVNVSPAIGIWAPRLPLCVCLGSDPDVSPVIGIRPPRLPLPVFVFLRFSRATEALTPLLSMEIRMYRMRYPSEHVSFPQSELL